MAITYVPAEPPSLGVLGDNALLIAVGLSAAVALVLGGQYADPRTAVPATLALLALTGLGYATARGSLLSRLILTGVMVGFVSLHIHLARGLAEFHYGVFVVLALLLVYRDWRPIVVAALGFGVAQLAMDRLQAAGWPVYNGAEASLPRTLLHLVFIAAQAAAEVVLARGMAAMAAEGEELSRLVAEVDQGEAIALDLPERPLRTPGGRALYRMLRRMARAVSALRQGSSRIDAACHEIACGNQDLSARTERTAHNLQRTAGSMVDLTTGARSADDQARQAGALARTAHAVAVDGGAVIARAVQTMQGIADSSRRIAEITGLIDGIAFRTNLLALNAAVEAARAGDQGRGFAVVAAEVRSLAQRSADAAREVRSLILDSTERVGEGSALMDRAGSTMDDIVGAVREVHEIMATLGERSRRQTEEVEALGDVMRQMDQATQQNAAMVEQLAAAADSLKAQSGELVGAVEVFVAPPGPAAA